MEQHHTQPGPDCWVVLLNNRNTCVPHGEQGERPGNEPGGGRRRQALGAPGADVVEPGERRGRADDPGDDGEDDEEPGRRVPDGEVDRGEVSRELQAGACIDHIFINMQQQVCISKRRITLPIS